MAAARAADADEDAVAHQLLQHRFEIAARDALALGDLRRTDRGGAPVIGDVEHRLDREQQLLGEPDHESGLSPRRPVWTSRSDAGRAEAALLAPAGVAERRDDREFGARDPGKDELRDAVARVDQNPLGPAVDRGRPGRMRARRPRSRITNRVAVPR